MVLHTTYVLEYHTIVVLYLVFWVLAGNSFRCFVHMVLIVQYSCVVVSVFGSGGKYTLLLYIPLLALTDRQTERDSNIHLLCVGWRNLFSFPVVLLCQFFVLAGNRFVLRSTIKLWCCV